MGYFAVFGVGMVFGCIGTIMMLLVIGSHGK